MKGHDNTPWGGTGPAPTPGSTRGSLIEGVRRRDPESERRLMYLYGPLVLRRCRARVRDHEHARDITQEVLLTAFARIDDFAPPATLGGPAPGPGFRPWLYAILRNKVGDHIRGQARQPVARGGSEARAVMDRVCDPGGGDSAATGDPPGAPSDEAILRRRALDLARADFEDRTWKAAYLRLAEGRPAAEIAAELGMRPGNVHVARARVLKRVRAILAEFEGASGGMDATTEMPEVGT